MLLDEVKGVGKTTLSKLNRLGIETVSDLLNFFPKKYIDLSNPVGLSYADDGQFVLLKIGIDDVKRPVKTKGGLVFFNADAVDLIGNPDCDIKKIRLVWFNQPYMRQSIAAGGEYLCFGKLRFLKNCVEIANPSVEAFCDAKKLVGILPVYRTKNKIGQSAIRSIIKDALSKFSPDGIIDRTVENKYALMPLAEAYIRAHLPRTPDEAEKAQARLLLEDTVKQIVYYKIIRNDMVKTRKNSYDLPKTVVKMFLNKLPFKLTDSQNKALDEVLDDFKSRKRMSRIIAGDVGSGKTVVAFAAMYFAVKCGYQAAMIAPTEILARQHYANALRFFDGLGVNVVYLSGGVKTAERKAILTQIATSADIVIGTHSLIGKDVKFGNLSFAVIDEQHKFGVVQKYDLEEKGDGVDTLTLSATPIPRSVAMVMYDELELGYVERRQDVGHTKTFIVSDKKREKMFEYIADEAKKGNQAFVVCPRIFDGEDVETYSAEKLFDELKAGVFADISVGLLHGKMSAAAKNKTMSDFAERKISVLVSTSVIEVGIDVENATTVAVLNSERFGLATLHQLRGRAGRGAKRANCFLHTSSVDNERLKIMTECSDGFEIAERDFAVRGGGDFLGTRQTGDVRIGCYSVYLTPNLIALAKRIAVDDVLNSDFKADSDEYNKYYNLLKDITTN